MKKNILPKKEIYKRGLLDFLQKKKHIHEKLWKYKYIEMDRLYLTKYKPVGYYVLDIIDLNDWYETFILKYDPTDSFSIENILFNDFNAREIENLADHLKIDDNLTTAGMKSLLFLSSGDGGWIIYTKDSFELKEANNKLSILEKYIYFYEGENIEWMNSAIESYNSNTLPSYYLFEIDDFGNAIYDENKVLENKINI